MNRFLENHHSFMQMALELAKKGYGSVSPNPLVGCVVVKNGKVIGEGYHEKFGSEHAEVNALRNCVESPQGASLYVNLEPCSIYGKTPPCTKLIIENSIDSVYIGTKDLNPEINGNGINELKKHGIKVEYDILHDKCYMLNKGFFKWIETKRPWVIAKVAQTYDGFMGIDSNNSIWLSGEQSKISTHVLRSQVDSIMVGKQTALVDNPSLTVRKVLGNNPIRVIVDTNRTLPLDLKVFTDEKSQTIVLCSLSKFSDSETSFSKYLGVEEVDGQLNPKDILKTLGKQGITTILIEGGSKLLESFQKYDLIDEIYIYKTEKIIKDAKLKNPLKFNDDWHIEEPKDIGEDKLYRAYKKEKCLQEL